MDTEISHNLLRRYIRIRRLVHEDIKTLYALSNVLAMFKDIHNDQVLIDPHVLARVNELMNQSVLNIWEQLDEFIPLAAAELTLQDDID